MTIKPWIAATAALAALWFAPNAAHATTPCERLKLLALPHASVTDAVVADAGGHPTCKIDVASRPTPDSDIRIEVWIPVGDAWNGRYVQLGNGGLGGSINSAGLKSVAAQGYAVAMTDDGHQSSANTDAAWALGHPEKIVDFGWRALKETTEDAKALIRAAQGSGPKYAYFNGCSDGGREALMEAQRFPDDFNGIVAGAPAYDMTGLFVQGAYYAQVLSAPGAYLPPDKLKILGAAALANCGGGPFIADPESCKFDPTTIACPPGHDSAGCLTAAQALAAHDLYLGVSVPADHFYMPGYTPGSEAERGGWAVWVTGPSEADMRKALFWSFGTGFFADFLYQDPNYDLLKVNIAQAPEAVAPFAKIIDSTDPDLSRFRAHGGKLIHYHGWSDPAIPARDSIVYYGNVRRAMGDPSDFYRLYMVPGMLHCGGGPGPSGVDWQAALQAWVEQGQPPAELTAGAGPASQAPRQLLCPYPEHAVGDAATGQRCVARRPSSGA